MHSATSSALIPQLTPKIFWSLHKREIQARGSWAAYQQSSHWTPIALGAAESVCKNQFGLQTAREYFKLDVLAWTGTDYDYDLRVAFEAEDSFTWEDELCKLAHIISLLFSWEVKKGATTKNLGIEKSRVFGRNCVVES